MRHIISILVENKFGVLARVSGLFSGRGFNINSLAVGETDDPTISRITIVTHGDKQIVEQIIKQLRRLIDTVKVVNLSETEHVERELCLIKINTSGKSKIDLIQMSNVFEAKIVDFGVHDITFEVTGRSEKIENFINLIKPFGIKSIARTGLIALARSRKK